MSLPARRSPTTPTRDNSLANSSSFFALRASPEHISHASDRSSALVVASTTVHGIAPKHATCQRLKNSSGLSRCNADGSFNGKLTSFARCRIVERDSHRLTASPP
ncbi:MAG: hypothetical protein ACR2KT_06840 [Methylocella sp.]|nr:MAG: hypothetical protein DLM68_09700 [Hyphomicrobiales bacterium]